MNFVALALLGLSELDSILFVLMNTNTGTKLPNLQIKLINCDTRKTLTYTQG